MSSADNYSLPLDAFVRTIGVNRNSSHALFLGAGASISSGIPSASMCIWEWKRDIFVTNNPGLEDQFSELSLPSVRVRIQNWLDRKGGHPPNESPDEYGYYIEKCFPIADSRRAFFQGKVQAAKPFVGYQLTCALAQAALLRSVWTTNFDGLVARAAAISGPTPIEVGIDSQHRAIRVPSKGEIVCVSLHGDYRYDALKNTAEELQNQEAQLRRALIEATRDTSFIVIGYSGRDSSIMQAFQDAYSAQGSGALYWCGFGDEIPASVSTLLASARAAGRTAYFVPTDGFDDVISRIARHCLPPEQRQKAVETLSQAANAAAQDRIPFNVDDAPAAAIIKSNAFEIDLPNELFAFDPKKWPSEKVWAWLREKSKGGKFIAVPFRKVLALGVLDAIREAFKEEISGAIERTPIGEKDLRHEDGSVVHLLRQALVRAIAAKRSLDTDGKGSLWEKAHFDTKTVDNRKFHIHRMLLVFLRRIAGNMHVVLKPSLHISSADGAEVPREIANSLKLNILGWQHNKEFNQAIEHWRRILFDDTPQTIFEYPDSATAAARFNVRRSPAFACIGDKSRSAPISFSSTVRPLLKQFGLVLREPPLKFVNAAGASYVTDTHPLRGLVRNRPYDFAITQGGLASQIRLGIVCPRSDARVVETYLHQNAARHQPGKTETDYLLEYPGFSQAFRLPLTIPIPGAAGWEFPPEIGNDVVDRNGAIECARSIAKAVDTLHATHNPDVTLIFVPSRWARFRQFETDTESFNLHDFVKAYCVQKGMPSQFLEHDTLTNQQQCRVWWWLSLALYVKSMRTPWVLDSLLADTAYVGLGFSIDRKAAKGQHIVLGCSHLYNAQGQGLQYRLSRIENATIINDNPFMSREDACRVGETVRQLFFDAQRELPRRVVIHKLTPFRRDEREGLREGLSGVHEIDMLEINTDDALRYVSSVPKNGGGFDEDNFPVRRGTVLKLDDYSALLWVHGATDAVRHGWKYFQGKRRIPAPTVLRRHAGRSDLSTLSDEILGLSKMDWNSADLYSKLPATVYSSKQIARLGILLQRFGPMSYDYRLFI